MIDWSRKGFQGTGVNGPYSPSHKLSIYLFNTITHNNIPPHTNCHHHISQVSGVSRCQQSPTFQLPTLCPSPTTCQHYITQVSGLTVIRLNLRDWTTHWVRSTKYQTLQLSQVVSIHRVVYFREGSVSLEQLDFCSSWKYQNLFYVKKNVSSYVEVTCYY